jgi:2-methylisocitrate lyase-like PEP mutase family enzyme
MSEHVNTFRKLHDGSSLLCLANAWDAGSARLVESLGASAIGTTSAGVAWSLGYGDGGAMPARVALAASTNIARVLSIPLTVDVEDGYSPDPDTVAGHVAQLVEAGVAGINIEDGAGDPAVLAAKIEAIRRAVAAAGADVFINVRTDVYLRGLAPEGARVPEVLARAKTYRDAGADGLFVPGICLAEEIREVATGIDLPLNVMDWPGLPSPADLFALGARRFSAGSGIAQILWGVGQEAARAFLAGQPVPLAGKAMGFGDIQQLFG